MVSISILEGIWRRDGIRWDGIGTLMGEAGVGC